MSDLIAQCLPIDRYDLIQIVADKRRIIDEEILIKAEILIRSALYEDVMEGDL